MISQSGRYAFEKLFQIRASNLLGRLFEKFRRKTDEIDAFPDEQSCQTIHFLAVELCYTKLDRPDVAKTKATKLLIDRFRRAWELYKLD